MKLMVLVLGFVAGCITPQAINGGPKGDCDDTGDAAVDDTAETGGDTDSGDTAESIGDVLCMIDCVPGPDSTSCGVYIKAGTNETYWNFGSADAFILESATSDDGGTSHEVCVTLPEGFAQSGDMLINGWDNLGEPAQYAADPGAHNDWYAYLAYGCTARGSALIFDEASGRCADVMLTLNGEAITTFNPVESTHSHYYNLHHAALPVSDDTGTDTGTEDTATE